MRQPAFIYWSLWLLIFCVTTSPATGRAAHGWVDGELVTGALVNEKVVTAVVHVDAAGRVPGSVPTIEEGLKRALETLQHGTATKVQIHPGVYRQSAADVNFLEPTVRDTLLVIEAAPGGSVVLSGADIFAANEWKDEGAGLWSHLWTHDFGNFAYPWSVSGVIGHRREMVWVDGRPLRPVLLENYDVKGLAAFGGSKVSWTYTGFLDPHKTMTQDTFGVAERDENGSRIYIRLAPGMKLPQRGIEIALRPTLLNLAGKTHIVLRGITFEKCANSDRDFGAESPVSFGSSFSEDNRPGDVLMEHCRFRWNSGTGFNLTGWRWTVRDCDFSYNGFSGLASSDARNVLFERVSANFNCWREFFAGNENWNYGAVKMHGVSGHKVSGYTAIGNASHGIWWDVHCGDVTFEDGVLIRNRRSFIYELSAGPFVARRILAVHGFRQPAKGSALDPACIVATSQRARIENSLFYTDSAPEVVGFLWYERDDEHARQKQEYAELFELRDCLIVGGPHVPFLLREGNVGDRKRESYRSFRYLGQNNVFFHYGKQRDVFGYQNVNYTLLKLDFNAWSARSERGARWLDPHLRDPDNYDFRFTPDSPLAGKAKHFPQYRISAALRAEMEQFFGWIGWKTAVFTPVGISDNR